MRWWIAGLLALSGVTPAGAQAPAMSTGESYFIHCALPKDDFAAFGCILYLRGVNDGLASWEKTTCNPGQISQHDRHQMLLSFLRQQPGLRVLSTAEIMKLVLLQAFGCLVDLPPPR